MAAATSSSPPAQATDHKKKVKAVIGVAVLLVLVVGIVVGVLFCEISPNAGVCSSSGGTSTSAASGGGGSGGGGATKGADDDDGNGDNTNGGGDGPQTPTGPNLFGLDKFDTQGIAVLSLGIVAAIGAFAYHLRMKRGYGFVGALSWAFATLAIAGIADVVIRLVVHASDFDRLSVVDRSVLVLGLLGCMTAVLIAVFYRSGLWRLMVISIIMTLIMMALMAWRGSNSNRAILLEIVGVIAIIILFFLSRLGLMFFARPPGAADDPVPVPKQNETKLEEFLRTQGADPGVGIDRATTPVQFLYLAVDERFSLDTRRTAFQAFQDAEGDEKDALVRAIQAEGGLSIPKKDDLFRGIGERRVKLFDTFTGKFSKLSVPIWNQAQLVFQTVGKPEKSLEARDELGKMLSGKNPLHKMLREDLDEYIKLSNYHHFGHYGLSVPKSKISKE